MDKSIDYTLCFVVVAINKIFKTVPKADAKKHTEIQIWILWLRRKQNCKQFIYVYYRII